jgi:flavin reductase (DIM6/NTAB) family NADH-FMN oxidoreductase RutF
MQAAPGTGAAGSIEPKALRDAFGRFATGVTIITTRDEDNRPVGFTANSFSSVSLDPPLVLFSLSRQADCHAAFGVARHFAINVLAAEQQPLSARFATQSPDKFQDLPFAEWETGCPIFPEALANFDCAVQHVAEGGDHVIFIGRVLRFAARHGTPLLFYRGGYGHLDGTRVPAPPPLLASETSALENGALPPEIGRRQG